MESYHPGKDRLWYRYFLDILLYIINPLYIVQFTPGQSRLFYKEIDIMVHVSSM